MKPVNVIYIVALSAYALFSVWQGIEHGLFQPGLFNEATGLPYILLVGIASCAFVAIRSHSRHIDGVFLLLFFGMCKALSGLTPDTFASQEGANWFLTVMAFLVVATLISAGMAAQGEMETEDRPRKK